MVQGEADSLGKVKVKGVNCRTRTLLVTDLPGWLLSKVFQFFPCQLSFLLSELFLKSALLGFHAMFAYFTNDPVPDDIPGSISLP